MESGLLSAIRRGRAHSPFQAIQTSPPDGIQRKPLRQIKPAAVKSPRRRLSAGRLSAERNARRLRMHTPVLVTRKGFVKDEYHPLRADGPLIIEATKSLSPPVDPGPGLLDLLAGRQQHPQEQPVVVIEPRRLAAVQIEPGMSPSVEVPPPPKKSRGRLSKKDPSELLPKPSVSERPRKGSEGPKKVSEGRRKASEGRRKGSEGRTKSSEGPGKTSEGPTCKGSEGAKKTGKRQTKASIDRKITSSPKKWTTKDVQRLKSLVADMSEKTGIIDWEVISLSLNDGCWSSHEVHEKFIESFKIIPSKQQQTKKRDLTKNTNINSKKKYNDQKEIESNINNKEFGKRDPTKKHKMTEALIDIALQEKPHDVFAGLQSSQENRRSVNKRRLTILSEMHTGLTPELNRPPSESENDDDLRVSHGGGKGGGHDGGHGGHGGHDGHGSVDDDDDEGIGGNILEEYLGSNILCPKRSLQTSRFLDKHKKQLIHFKGLNFGHQENSTNSSKLSKNNNPTCSVNRKLMEEILHNEMIQTRKKPSRKSLELECQYAIDDLDRKLIEEQLEVIESD